MNYDDAPTKLTPLLFNLAPSAEKINKSYKVKDRVKLEAHVQVLTLESQWRLLGSSRFYKRWIDDGEAKSM